MNPAMPYDLRILRVRASQFFAGLLWLHVLVVISIAQSNHVAPLRVGTLMAVAAAVSTLAAWRSPGSLTTRLVIATALTVAPALMVYAGMGDWQIDWHVYFFVVFGMLVAFVDWRPIVLSAILTAGHHLFLNLVFPNGVFPEPGLARVALHAGMVATECIVLIWITVRMKRLFEDAADTHERLTREVENHARAQQTAHLGSWERDLRTGSVMWSDELYRICGLEREASPPRDPGAFDHRMMQAWSRRPWRTHVTLAKAIESIIGSFGPTASSDGFKSAATSRTEPTARRRTCSGSLLILRSAKRPRHCWPIKRTMIC